MFQPAKKLLELPFAALTAATRTSHVDCTPLTCDSDKEAITAACKAIAASLEDEDDKELKLKCLLAFPSPDLVDAFAASLRVQDGELAQATERQLAVIRVQIVTNMIKAAPRPANVKMKDLFRRIKSDHPDVWASQLEHNRHRCASLTILV